MNDFAYGYDIIFNCSDGIKSSKVIYVSKLKSIPLHHYPLKIDFETNQDRAISLRLKEEFNEKTSLSTWVFVVEGVLSFLVNSQTNQIFYQKDYNYTDKLMNYWLIHIILPIYFTLNNNYYFLHTGSICLEDRAVLFMGDSYAGKSTLTDYFLKKGHSLLSDDKLATYIKENIVFCRPSHQYHRPYRETETLGVKAENFSTKTLELGVIYWITPVEKDKKIKIKELKGLEKFEVLRYSTEMDLYVNQEKRFEYITKLANITRVYNINIPMDLERLEEVYNTVLAHINTGC